jgi:signal peptidase II
VRFTLWDNLAACLRRFQFIRVRVTAKRHARNEKLMLIAMASAVGVFAADQASKAFVLSRTWAADSATKFLCIRKVLNRRGQLMFYLAPRTQVGLWLAAVAIAAVLLHQGLLPQNAMSAVGIGAALGGAAGNLADRLRCGAIVDFIVIGRWPPFNLADAAIVVGVGLLILSFLET